MERASISEEQWRVLRAASLFAVLGEEQLAAVVALGRIEQAPEGMVVFREGDEVDLLRVILAGRAELSIQVPGTGEAVVATVSVGEILGCSALLAPAQWWTSARTVKPTTLLTVPAVEMMNLCDRDHDLGYLLLRATLTTAMGRLRDTRLRLLDMFGES